ncbi:MAG: hypothetical protein HY537_14160 [Deltaproteobacteria bacterium]|nr:hypothetical protein [Deltaproteobacteria bacterium]
MAPLKDNVQIALYVDGKGPVTLTKEDGKPILKLEAPQKAEMSFHVPAKAADSLLETRTEDIGELGLTLLKLVAHSDPQLRVKPQVHIGLFEMFSKGYLGVIPLGGVTVMKFLASLGFGSIGKIKEVVTKLRN